MATIRAVPRSRSTSQAVQIYEDPAEHDVPVHDIHLDTHDLTEPTEPQSALEGADTITVVSEDSHVQDLVRDFEQLASSEHDAALAAEYDNEEEEHSEVDELSDEDEEEDPFESSELSDNGLDVQHSIEHDTPFRHERFSGRLGPVMRTSTHGYDRSFSTTTAIHLDDHVNPQIESSEEEDDSFAASENLRHAQDHEEAADYIKAPVLDDQGRAVSQTWSALPDELPSYYKSPLPGRTMLYSHARSPLSASRSHLASPPSPSPLANRERLLSSPTRSSERYLSTPTRHTKAHSIHHLQEQDDAHQYSASGRPVFRNPSSVRRMQMSSPPPFSPTSPPRAARHRREQSEVLHGSRQQSPFPQMQQQGSAPGTPQRHPNPKKDYPLVLLHCTLAPLPSTFAFSPAVLEQVLPAAKLRDVALLKERLGSGGATVLERGVLIPHPGDDYELLEERVLESLELRRPRVGGCGHFNPDVDADTGGVPNSTDMKSGDENQTRSQDADCKCADCGNHMDHALLPGVKAERRWDVRVYAANGLMRSGAWSAAWREMEKVDVEVGVWLDDGLRNALEGASIAEEAETDHLGQRNGRQQKELGTIRRAGEASRQLLPPPAPMPPSASDAGGPAASTATARPGTSGRTKARRMTTTEARGFDSTRNAGQGQEKLPLQTLLFNYIARTAEENRGLILAVAVLLAGIWLAITSSSGSTANSKVATPAVARLASAGMAGIPTSTAVITSTETATATETVMQTLAAPGTLGFAGDAARETLTVTTTVTEQQLAAATPFDANYLDYGVAVSSACTFAAADAADNGDMTALPRDVAARVLGALATSMPAADKVPSLQRDTEAYDDVAYAELEAETETEAGAGAEIAVKDFAMDEHVEMLADY